MPGPSRDTTRPLPVPQVRFWSDAESCFGPTLLQATLAGHTYCSLTSSLRQTGARQLNKVWLHQKQQALLQYACQQAAHGLMLVHM